MINEMAPHSEFVDFQCKLMPFFLKKFDKVKSRYFPGYDGIAFFAGTVLHSLEHSAAEWNMEDLIMFLMLSQCVSLPQNRNIDPV